MTLEGRTQKISNQMHAANKLVILSKKETYRIDHNHAMKFAPIKSEFMKKHRVSIAYVADVESGRMNFNKQSNFYKSNNFLNNMYEKIKTYFLK